MSTVVVAVSVLVAPTGSVVGLLERAKPAPCQYTSTCHDWLCVSLPSARSMTAVNESNVSVGLVTGTGQVMPRAAVGDVGAGFSVPDAQVVRCGPDVRVGRGGQRGVLGWPQIVRAGTQLTVQDIGDSDDAGCRGLAGRSVPVATPGGMVGRTGTGLPAVAAEPKRVEPPVGAAADAGAEASRGAAAAAQMSAAASRFMPLRAFVVVGVRNTVLLFRFVSSWMTGRLRLIVWTDQTRFEPAGTI